MFRVRFHGRGGHGIKTASRIVGTAAFLAGYHAQDSPVYGAERRGAAITAFTRIDQTPILERGLIDRPDLIVVADETLLDDAMAGVLVGQNAASAVFVNADSSNLGQASSLPFVSVEGRQAGSLSQKYGIRPQLVTFDVTGLTLNVLGKASALSAGVGAVAVRLLGVIPEDRLVEAIREELGYLDLAPELIEKNVRIASEVFAALRPVEFRRVEQPSRAAVVSIGYESPLRGTPSIFAAGNAAERHTGSWRLVRPEINYDRCTRCGICFVRCPDGAISLDDQGYPIIDFDHCKGCGICWEVCPVAGIAKRKEVRAW
jgi:pyruvate ferredoxin oxidoreductase gamma subunit